jgi:hypothetical protein
MHFALLQLQSGKDVPDRKKFRDIHDTLEVGPGSIKRRELMENKVEIASEFLPCNICHNYL